MPDCQHRWKMTNVHFGFTVFERCSHCQQVRTYYSTQDTWDEYREGDCTWTIVENAQNLRFDLECETCQQAVSFADLRGLMYCTSCMDDCQVECVRKELERQKTWILVALPHDPGRPVGADKLAILTDYFNQRRDTRRSRIKIVGFDLVKTMSLCKGDFIRDVGMLSPEPVVERSPLL